MKRFLLSCFLLVFLLNLVGWQWIFIHEQNLHRTSTWNSLQNNNQGSAEVVITVSKGQAKNVCPINSHEIVFQGRLYDVSNIQKVNDETIYYCSADNEEEQLITSYDEIVKNNFAPDATVQAKSLKLIKGLDNFLAHDSYRLFENKITLFVSPSSTCKLSKPFLDVATMPPDALCAVIANEA